MEENLKPSLIRYHPFTTVIDPTFWLEIKRIKLDTLKLELKPIEIFPTISFANNDSRSIHLNYESFEKQSERGNRSNSPLIKISNWKKTDNPIIFDGKILIYNTKKEFDSTDKRELLIKEGERIWMKMNDEQQQRSYDESLSENLAKFFMIVFGDFKSYDFYYWSAYPSLSFPPNCHLIIDSSSFSTNSLGNWSNYFDSNQTKQLIESFNELSASQQHFFAIVVPSKFDQTNDNQKPSEFFQLNRPIIYTFTKFWSLETIEKFSMLDEYKIFVSFPDFIPFSPYPNWLLRNYLSYLHVRLGQLLQRHHQNSKILSFINNFLFVDHLKIFTMAIKTDLNRSESEFLDESFCSYLMQNSFVRHIAFLPANHKKIDKSRYLEEFIKDMLKLYPNNREDDVDGGKRNNFIPPAIGWERNKKLNNRLIPNHINCSSILDPKIMASDALSLNLKLMKWRLVPRLDLDLIHQSRCLIIGSGTIGCNIGRLLVAWGFNQITFIDNKNVSYSNPARQSLFHFEDAIGGRKSKSMVASKALSSINPSIDSRGVNLEIEIPDHPLKFG
ncbi:hypothetical protein SSS_05711 [Sarcoptes scabiei]|nr:hypothetical protein SSS_05711 [Sarcoptes scabiei]